MQSKQSKGEYSFRETNRKLLNTKQSFYYRIQCDPAQRQFKPENRNNFYHSRGSFFTSPRLVLGTGAASMRVGAAVATLEVATAVQPGSLEAALGLEGADLALHLESETNVIEAVDEAVLAEAVDLEGSELVALGVLDLLVDKVDLNFAAGVGLSGDLSQSGFVGDRNGKHAVLEGVVEENIGEGGGDDALDAEIKQSPGGRAHGSYHSRSWGQ